MTDIVTKRAELGKIGQMAAAATRRLTGVKESRAARSAEDGVSAATGEEQNHGV